MIEHKETAQHWGDAIKPKESATIRLLVQTIGGIDMTDSGLIKLAAPRNFINENQVDICMITE